MRTLRVAFVAILAWAVVGCSVTRIISKVDQNPLKQVAEKASRHYTVKWDGENKLRLRDAWFWHSVLALGYSAFYADLTYTDKQLDSKFYLKSRQLFLLIPMYLDTSPGLVGAALKPAMRTQMHEILDWAGVAKSERLERYCSP